MLPNPCYLGGCIIPGQVKQYLDLSRQIEPAIAANEFIMLRHLQVHCLN
jgi:hypothetical protein